MTWADFYLICFLVGFALSLISFLSGGLHGHFHLPNMPHGHGMFGHLFDAHGMSHPPVAPHAPAGVNVPGSAQAPVAGNAPAKAGASAAQTAQTAQISPFNFITLTAFLAWFGGTGYLLTRYETLWFMTGLGIALVSGIVGAGAVYLFLAKVLTSPEENMDSADYEMVGVLGRTSLPIREGGTGEIIYSQAGTRRTCGARSENGTVIPRGVEVLVTRYDRGIAYVRPWEEMSGDDQ
jgi:hypothetical protein